MKLDRHFVQLPLQFDAERLAAEVAAIPEPAWRPHPQGFAGNAALPLIALHGNPADDAANGPMRPTPHLERMPYFRQVLARLGTVWGRTRLMRLDGNAEASAHCDVHYYWQDHIRVHVPVETTPAVRFTCGEHAVHMAAGECWIFDTMRRHSAVNPEPTRRIHLVADTVGSAAFFALVARGRDPLAPPSDWTPERVPWRDGAATPLQFESVNHPRVMSPWELRARVAFVLSALEAESQAPLAARLREEFAGPLADWRALWARFGDAPAGHAEFAHLALAMRERLAPLRGAATLEGVDAIEWFDHTVFAIAIAGHALPRPAACGTGRPAPANANAASAADGAPDVAAPATATVVPGAADSATAASAAKSAAVVPARASVPARPVATERHLDRPVFVVCPPRSGSSLLFETLAQAPRLYTIGGESHRLIEAVPGLAPAARGFDSNRLTAADATSETVAALTRAFLDALRDRDGAGAPLGPVRLLEKTPKNALRVQFLAAAFPGARFVYLYRDPRETLSSMLDAWRSGRFVTYPQLPDWSGPLWSLLLTPGWRELAGRPLEEIVARQWQATIDTLLDDLDTLAPERWCVASYDRLVAEPQAEIERLCGFLELDWDRELTAPLPLARHALSSPDPEKWRRNAEELKRVMPGVTATAERARAVFGRPPATRPVRRRTTSGVSPATSVAGDPAEFRSVHSASFPEILARLGVSLAVSTYQSGRLVVVRADEGRLNTHLSAFASPMGIALGRRALALGTLGGIVEFRNQPAVAAKIEPAGRHDACYLPRATRLTGDIRVHEMAYDADDALWIVNTRFSCLCQLDDEHSFVPRWRPPFVSRLAAEDRCHLNGLALEAGRVRYVTALGTADTAQGWRETKTTGGVLIEVPGGEIVARGLCMPHSPRLRDGRLWVLQSGRGEIGTVDPSAGRYEPVAELPGFTRGLAFAGPFAFVGLSQVRESVFAGLPLGERLDERACGVWIVDLRDGRTAGFLRFEGIVQEIFDVQVLPHRYPEIAEWNDDLGLHAFVLPDADLAETVQTEPRARRAGIG